MSIRLVAVMLLTVVATFSACAKRTPLAGATPPPSIETAPSPPPPPLDSAAMSAPERALTEEELFARKSLDQLNAERPLGEVYFRLDDNSLTDEGRETLRRNAEWLRRWTSTRATIEGHCDERGTSEYNLALGERRAQTVREYLVSLGVDSSRLVTVTRGKESPVCGDAEESCWGRNRRAQSILTAK